MPIDDLWYLNNRDPNGKRLLSKRHGRGKRWCCRYEDANGQVRERLFERKSDAEAWDSKVRGGEVGNEGRPEREADDVPRLRRTLAALPADRTSPGVPSTHRDPAKTPPFAALVPPLPVPEQPDFAALPVAKREDGELFRLRLLGTQVPLAEASTRPASRLILVATRVSVMLMDVEKDQRTLSAGRYAGSGSWAG